MDSKEKVLIPKRDKSKVYKSKSSEGSYKDQVSRAFELTFTQYEETLYELSKV